MYISESKRKNLTNQHTYLTSSGRSKWYLWLIGHIFKSPRVGLYISKPVTVLHKRSTRKVIKIHKYKIHMFGVCLHWDFFFHCTLIYLQPLDNCVDYCLKLPNELYRPSGDSGSTILYTLKKNIFLSIIPSILNITSSLPIVNCYGISWYEYF